MRRPVIAGNWKMFKTRDEALEFIYAVNSKVPSLTKVESVVCAQFTVLRCLVKRQGENLRIGAQNMHYAKNGAYTGEVSAEMLKSLDISYVIIGHSERRAMFNETDEDIQKKVKVALDHDIIPILCVGESLEQRENNTTKEVILNQITKDLSGLTPEEVSQVVIAYEPIWAIGTGKTATPEIAEETCGWIREMLRTKFDEVADDVRILYGGSVKTNNIDVLMSQPNIDGALIGGASLIPDDFLYFLEAAERSVEK